MKTKFAFVLVLALVVVLDPARCLAGDATPSTINSQLSTPSGISSPPAEGSGVGFTEIIAALGALIILARLIVKLTPTPKDDSFLEKVVTFCRHVGLHIPLIAFCIFNFAFLIGCGGSGHVGSSYDPATGDVGAIVGYGNTNVTVDLTGTYNTQTGQPGPITVVVTFPLPPDRETIALLEQGRVARLQTTDHGPQTFILTLPSVRDPGTPQFLALRAALAEGASITKAPSKQKAESRKQKSVLVHTRAK